MASRTQQKEQARQRRLAEEQARAEKSRRQRRLQMILGTVVIAVVLVVVAIVVSSGGSGSKTVKAGSPAAKHQVSQVSSLLAGIPQAGNRLGSPSAPVTVTEFADLECPACQDFTLNTENQLIAKDVKSGKVQLVYRSFCTATCNGPGQSVFLTQQAAANAAGLQRHQWDYVELFYHQQGAEGTNYVNDAYLNNLAKQIPGLNVAKWSADRSSTAMSSQVSSDEQLVQTRGYQYTPTIVVQGPKGQAQPIQGATDYATLQKAIQSVS